MRIERGEDTDSDDDAPRGGVSWPILAMIVAGVLIVGGAVGWLVKPAPAPAADEAADTSSASTTVTAGTGGAVSAGGLVASGYVVAQRQATVAAEVTGRVLDIRFEEGQSVQRGQILATLEPTLARAEAASAQARAAAADADMAEARRVLDRTHTLSQQGFASNAALTAAQSRYDQAAADRNAARADAQRASAQLARYAIRAPFTGMVTNKAAQAGEIISPVSAGGGFTRTGLCTIVDMTSLEIWVDVSEAYIARVTPNQRVEAVLDAYPDVSFPAHVIATIPTADRSRATVRVRIGFDHLDPRILPEMAIKVTFLDNQQQH